MGELRCYCFIDKLQPQFASFLGTVAQRPVLVIGTGRPDTLDRRAYTTLDVESRHLLRRLYGLLERLEPRDRLIFVLHRMESMSVEEISTAMEISESTVKRSLAHASQRIRHWIDAEPRWLKGEEWGQ